MRRKHADDPLCRACGLTEDEHCVFEAKTCRCDDGTWSNGPGPVCARYNATNGGNCVTCEHDEECHDLTPNNAQRSAPTKEETP